MTDRSRLQDARSADEKAFAASWSLVDEDGNIESVSSDESSTTDFLVDPPPVLASKVLVKEDDVRTVPIADYHNLVMVDIPSADETPTSTLVNLESDEDIVHIVDDATDDNLDDWVTHEVERRRSSLSPKLPKTSRTVNAQRRDLLTEEEYSSECSAGSSDESSWAGETIDAHDSQARSEEPEDMSAVVEELPADYPQGYHPSSRTYIHQRNNDANKCLTISLFVVLTIVSAVAFGHFRGTTVLTRHSHFGAAFEAATPGSPSNILSDIQKDQTEILRQLQQMLNVQIELKQRITSLEDENKDLRLRLLENRKKCTRILHRTSGYADPPVVASNVSDNDDQHGIITEALTATEPAYESQYQSVDSQPNTLPLSLAAVVRAQQAVRSIRTNFQPVDGPVIPPSVHDPRREDFKLRQSAFTAKADRFLRIPPEQVDFVMVEDVVVPLEGWLGSHPIHRTFPFAAHMVPGDKRNNADRASAAPADVVPTSQQQPSIADRKFAYSERSKDDLLMRGDTSGAHIEIPRVKMEQSAREKHDQRELTSTEERQLGKQSTDDAFAESGQSDYQRKVNQIKADLHRERERIAAGRKDLDDSDAWRNSSDPADSHPTEDAETVKQQIPPKHPSTKTDSLRPDNHQERGYRKLIYESDAWKNTSNRWTRKVRSNRKETKSHRTTKYSSNGPCKNGQSADGYCYLKPNKYRKPEKEACQGQFWKSLPGFFKKQFAKTENLQRVFKDLGADITKSKVYKKVLEEVQGLGADISQSKVFRKVMEEVPKQFKGFGSDIVRSKTFKKVMEEVPKQFKMSSEWLDCQWQWWQGFAQHQPGASSGCTGYLTSWQHKQHEKKPETHEKKQAKKHSEKEIDETTRKKTPTVIHDMNDSNESNWFFRRASDRAQFRQRLLSAGRRMGNLTSWFFQRAKDREQQRLRYLDDSDYADANRQHRHARGTGLPADPIYAFLKHRAAWRRSAQQYDV